MLERTRYKGGYAHVAVWPAWESFEAFKEYVDEELGEKPAGYSLDRIDNDGDYEPGNIKWSSPKEQMRNRRCTKYITADGETLSVPEWAERLGIRIQSVYGRLERGWSEEDAVLTPAGGKCASSQKKGRRPKQ